MAYKMKGSPMQRNFGISPVKQKPGGSAGEALDSWEKYRAGKMKAKDMVDTKRVKLHMVDQKKFNLRQSSKQKAYEYVKNLKNRGDLNLAKSGSSSGWSKAMKLGGKLLGTIGGLYGGDVNATASGRNLSTGEEIKDLLTKHNLKGGR